MGVSDVIVSTAEWNDGACELGARRILAEYPEAARNELFLPVLPVCPEEA